DQFGLVELDDIGLDGRGVFLPAQGFVAGHLPVREAIGLPARILEHGALGEKQHHRSRQAGVGLGLDPEFLGERGADHGREGHAFAVLCDGGQGGERCRKGKCGEQAAAHGELLDSIHGAGFGRIWPKPWSAGRRGGKKGRREHLPLENYRTVPYGTRQQCSRGPRDGARRLFRSREPIRQEVLSVTPPTLTISDETLTDRQKDVLDAALGLLVDGGDGLTMTGVARRASCSKETLYKWFGDRDGLLTATVQWQAAKVRMVPLDRETLDKRTLAIALEKF